MYLDLWEWRISGVGLDVDGTLIFSEKANRDGVDAACRRYGIPFETTNERELMGASNEDIFTAITQRFGTGSALALAEIIDFKRNYFIEHLRECEPVPGAVEFARAVRRVGLPIAIATAAGSRSLNASLSALGLRANEFDVLLPADILPPRRSKPHEYHWRETARRCGVETSEFLVVEDSPRGITSAVRAGCITIGITTTHHAGELWKAGVFYVVDSFAELAGLLRIEI